jgi:hypothetical protein
MVKHKIDKDRFYIEIKKLVNKGFSYINSICFLAEAFDLTFKDIVKVMDDELKKEVKKEAIKKGLVHKNKKEDNVLKEVFK